MAKLKIISNNPDYVGEWTKKEVIEEMASVDVTAKDNNWLDWVFDRDFDDGYPNEILNVLKLNTVTHVVIEAFINNQHTVISFDRI